MVQQVKALPGMATSLTRTSVSSCDSLLPIQLPANVPGKQQKII